MDVQMRSGSEFGGQMPAPMVMRFSQSGLRRRGTYHHDPGRIIGINQETPTACQEAADHFVRQAHDAIRLNGRFNVALCGGGMAEKMCDLLSRPPLANQVEWGKTHLYLVNELGVPSDDRRSHFQMLKTGLLAQVPVPLAQIHPIPSQLPASLAAVYYNHLMQALFDSSGLDMVFLQWGEYGHNHFFANQTPVVQKTHAWVAELYFPKRNLYAITLTMRAVYRARKAVFLIHQNAKEYHLKNLSLINKSS